MQNMDWDDVHHFLHVVRSGSVTKAARQLGVNQTTVSRRISALEKHLGKKLFERLVNGWVLTAVGEQLIRAAEHMEEEAQNIERHVHADSHELRGKLRVTVAESCTQDLAMPAFLHFTRAYPEVELEIIASWDELDLAAREADIALRTTDAPPANVVGKRIAQLAYAVYGTEETLENLKKTADDQIPCITWLGDGSARPAWIEKNFPETRRVYRTNALGLMLKMLCQGIGIAQIPCVFGDQQPMLHRLPLAFVEAGWGLWVLTHVDVRTTARVRIFRDLLVNKLEQCIDLIEGRARRE